MTDPIDLEALRGHTPGPWEWVEGTRGPRLSTPDRGKLIVMDFVRCGMQGAQPRFARWDGIDKGSQRTRMGGILSEGTDHPDARLIAAAPELFDECERLRAELTARRARDAEVEALVAALRHARDELASFPRSLGYAITALPKIDAALLPFQRNGDKT
jgi:hypothetical protein